MGPGEIPNMHVVAEPGAVPGGPINTCDGEYSLALVCFDHFAEGVCRLGVLEAATHGRICADGVEVAQRDHVHVAGGGEVTQDAF